jgi:hypothetical protein
MGFWSISSRSLTIQSIPRKEDIMRKYFLVYDAKTDKSTIVFQDSDDHTYNVLYVADLPTFDGMDGANQVVNALNAVELRNFEANSSNRRV